MRAQLVEEGSRQLAIYPSAREKYDLTALPRGGYKATDMKKRAWPGNLANRD
jgi:hypothetical protein